MSSRESDSAYPPPRRTGPDAYPSGTPPYGTGIPGGFPADPFGGPTGPGAEAPDEDVPKTETTLTTRVRINIPGSRPIPPVVVRSAVKNEDAPAEPTGPRHRADTGGSPVLGVVDAGARSATPPNLPPEWQESRPGPAAGPSESESTGEWFKPRQKGARPAERQDTQAPAPVPAAAAAAPAGAGPRPAPAARPGGPAARARPAGAQRPGGAPASPFAAAERPGPAEDPFAGIPAPAGQGRGPAPEGRFAGDPFATGRRQDAPAGAPGRGVPQGAAPFAGPPAAEPEPEDTQIGGFDPIRDEPGPAGISDAPAGHRRGPNADPFATGHRTGPNAGPFAKPDPFAKPEPAGAFARPQGPGAFAGPQGGAAPAADPFARPVADPFNSPQPPADPFGTTAPKPGGRFADVPFDPAASFPGSPKASVPQESPADAGEEAPSAPAPAKEAPAKSRGRGRKLAVYAVGGLLFAGSAAYGTGLMLNQADIPKGTTVLGTDIGGDTRDQAVSALDASVGKTGQQPIKLKIGGQDVQLDPASAGLSFDTTATVDGLTQHSYNPVDVIGSLAGGSKAVTPVVHVDRAKLKSALDGLAAASGQGLQEGFVQFTDDGKAVVVPGKAGQALDTAAAVDLVDQAYRGRAAGQPDGTISLALTAAQPKIGQDALQAAADGLGKQVLNGQITVTAGGKTFSFGAHTAAKTLTLVAADDTGKTFVPKWDQGELAKAIGTTFDKVKFRKAGALVAVTPQDVADAIAGVFDKTGKDRKVTLPS